MLLQNHYMNYNASTILHSPTYTTLSNNSTSQKHEYVHCTLLYMIA